MTTMRLQRLQPGPLHRQTADSTDRAAASTSNRWVQTLPIVANLCVEW